MWRRSVLVSALVAGVFLLSGCGQPAPAEAPVRRVKVVTVAPPVGTGQFRYAADIRPRSEVSLAFQVPGRLQDRHVEVGQVVQAGEVLARLAPEDLSAARQAAREQLRAAQLQRDQTLADRDRYEQLFRTGFISQAEMERRRTAADQAEAVWQQAQAQLEIQSRQAGYTQLRADSAGVVVAVSAEPGQVLAAGMPVLSLARQVGRDAVFHVPETEWSRWAPGQSVQLQLWGQGEDWHAAQVRERAASADPATRTFQIRVGVPTGLAAPLGSTATVRTLVTNGMSSGVAVPATAVWKRADDTVVWVLDAAAMAVHARPVQLGTWGGDRVQVTAGLSEGEEVVAVGGHLLSEGEPVRRFDSGPSASDR